MDDLDDDFEDDDDLEDEDDLEDDFEDADEEVDIPDAFTLQSQCRECSPNYPEWLKKDIIRYIEAYNSDLNKLSEFLGIHIGSLVIWKRKFGSVG